MRVWEPGASASLDSGSGRDLDRLQVDPPAGPAASVMAIAAAGAWTAAQIAAIMIRLEDADVLDRHPAELPAETGCHV